MGVSKKMREAVYAKYEGRCGYCGNPIEYKDMQIDHIQPQRCMGTDDIDNLMPTCRLCNHYKRGNSLYQFKHWLLGGLIERIRKMYIVRVAERYGMVEFHEWDKRFYFERDWES